MKDNNNQPRGGGVVYDPRNLKKKSVVIDANGNLIEVKTPQEKKEVLKRLIGRR